MQVHWGYGFIICLPAGTWNRNLSCAEGCECRETLERTLASVSPSFKGDQRTTEISGWILLLSLIIENVRSSFIYYNALGCGAILGTICKGIVLWEDTVGPCVFSSNLREQILHFLIKQEYKWSFHADQNRSQVVHQLFQRNSYT